MRYAERIEVVGDQVKVHFKDARVQDIPVTAVAIIGEYTNEDGPFADDHFLVIVTRAGQCIETAVDSMGPDALVLLGALLGQELSTSLDGQTTFNSRVLWPAQIADKPLMSFTQQSLFTVRSDVLKYADYGL